MSTLLESLPLDPEEAFLVLELSYRQELERLVARAEDEHLNSEAFYVDYLAQVIAAIHAFELDAAFGGDLPTLQDLSYETYAAFSKTFKYYRTTLELRHVRRVQGYSVAFDLATKERVKHHIRQLGDIFGKLEVEERKREVLLAKLNQLQNEVERDRTRFDAFAALSIETAGVVGEAIEKSKILKLLNAIAGVIWGAKEEEGTRQLPAPTKPKQIEPPGATKAKPRDFSSDPDDEIPF